MEYEISQVRMDDHIKISRSELEMLVKDVIKLKQSLSSVLDVEGLSFLYKKIYSLEKEVYDLKAELEQKLNETGYLKNKLNELLQETEQYREENFQLKNAVNVLNQERSDEYGESLSFVRICLSVLWHVSLNDNCVTAMLSWQTIEEFLDFIARSLVSFIESNKEGIQLDSNSDEFRLVITVCGIITNIAATAFGREFLISKENGAKVLDSLILYLSEMPCQHSVQVKTLILKALYNVSINAKGLEYLTSKRGLVSTLGLMLQEETDAELRVSLIRCIQSLILEPDNPSLAHEVMEVVSMNKLQEHADLSKGDLKRVTLELISDLTVFIQSQP